METPRALRLAAAFLVVLVGISSTGPRAAAETTDEERQAEVKLIKLINRGRVAKNLKALREHEVIREEAIAHSERMANQQTLSHNAFDGRTSRIAAADPGIDPDQICENVGSADVSNIAKAMKGLHRAWKRSETQASCLFDRAGYSTRSGAVGVEFRDGTWWVTFIAAHDETR